MQHLCDHRPLPDHKAKAADNGTAGINSGWEWEGGFFGLFVKALVIKGWGGCHKTNLGQCQNECTGSGTEWENSRMLAEAPFSLPSSRKQVTAQGHGHEAPELLRVFECLPSFHFKGSLMRSLPSGDGFSRGGGDQALEWNPTFRQDPGRALGGKCGATGCLPRKALKEDLEGTRSQGHACAGAPPRGRGAMLA